MKIKLVDEICGTGKSYWMFQQMRKWYKQGVYEQFVYISPLLSEVGGKEEDGEVHSGTVQQECPELQFQYPKKVHGSKLVDVKGMLDRGCNVAATHALFRMMDDTCREYIRGRRNVLVIDEAVSAIEYFDGVSPQGIRSLIKGGQLVVSDGNRLIWNHEEYPVCEKEAGKRFEYWDLVEVCDSGYAYLCSDSEDESKRAIILWQFPKELLECFTEVYVLTYMFEGSVMNSWVKIHGIDVERIHPTLYKTTSEVKAELKDRIKLYDSRSLRRIGEYNLSQTFWRNTVTDEEIDDITGVLSNTVRNHISKAGVGVKDILVTCPKIRWFKDDNVYWKLVRGNGYARAEWIPSNCKATNLFSDKRAMIYMINKYPQSLVSNFCAKQGSKVDSDLFAISEAIQAIFRTCIRKKGNEVLHLVLVSNRMRELFKQWLNGEGVFNDE